MLNTGMTMNLKQDEAGRLVKHLNKCFFKPATGGKCSCRKTQVYSGERNNYKCFFHLEIFNNGLYLHPITVLKMKK